MQSLSHQTLRIADRRIELQLPADPERLLAEAAESGGATDPYWGILWDAAVETASCVLKTEWAPGQRALEIGCGAGLVGVAGLLAGLDVTFADSVQEAVELAVINAAANGFPNAMGRVMNWNDGASDVYDVLLASDVLYEANGHRPLLEFARQSLTAEGCLWIGDPGRRQAGAFMQLAGKYGWHVKIQDPDFGILDVPAVANFQLIVLSRDPHNGESLRGKR